MANKIQGGTFSWIKNKQKTKQKKKNDKKLFLTNLMFRVLQLLIQKNSIKKF